MSAQVVFHAVTKLVDGTDRLIPLSDLAAIDPPTHAHAMSKYDDTPERRRLAQTRIPLIDRGWTDVVFLSPIHPHAFWSAWRDVSGDELPPVEFWQIPLHAVPTDAVVFDRSTSTVGDPIHEHEVTLLDRSAYRASTRTTDANREWLRGLAQRGKRGAWFNLTPHVLTAGPISLEDATVVSWERPAR